MSEYSKTEFIDLNNELSGADGNKHSRFLDDESTLRGRQEKQRKKDEETRYLNRLLEMLKDPAYVAAREEFGEYLRDVEIATQNAISTALTDLERANAHLSSTLETANRLPNGQAVFRDQHGNVYTADKTLISPEDAASIVWQDGAPTHEEYQGAQKAAANAHSQVKELETYQTDVLGGARDRFDDEENPMTQDEFKDQKERIEKIMPDIVAQQIEAISPTVKPQTLGVVSKPTL